MLRLAGRKGFALSLAGMVLTSFVGWWYGSTVKSPEEAAASALAPTPSVVSAPVVQRRISETLNLRGKVKSPRAMDVELSSLADGEAVITRLGARPGDEIVAGDVLLELSERPLIALQGRIPAYRSLSVGMQGRDVAQLEKGLASLGLMGTPDSVFGPDTSFGVQRLYDNAGYSLRSATDGSSSTSQRLAAQAAVDAARRRVVEAQIDVEEAGKEHESTVSIAVARYARAKRNPRTTSEEIASARLELVRARGAARRSAAATHHAVEAAQDDLDIALASLDEQGTREVVVTRSEILFSPLLPAVVTESTARLGETVTRGSMRLAVGTPVIESLLVEGERELVELGDAATVDAELVGMTFNAHVTEIGRRPVTTRDGLRGYVTILEAVRPLPMRAIGADTRITIRAVKTDAKLLAVPLAAVWTGLDEILKVTKVTPGGVERDVVVDVGPSGDGYVAIEPQDADLRPGDRVVLGY